MCRLFVASKSVAIGIIGAICVQGCFVQDFNKSARVAGYDSSGKTPLASSTKTTKSSKPESKAPKSSKQASKHDFQILAALHKQQSLWSKTPYISGGTKRSGADCSGFVQSVFSDSFALQLPRTTTEQMKGGKKLGGRHINHAKLRAGDLVFFKTGRGALGYHVGIYLENGDFLHLSAKGGAKIASLHNSYWQPKLIQAVRYAIPQNLNN